MASPEKIAPLLPETLPEDFGDWDSEGSPVASPGNSDEWEALGIPHSFAKSPKPLDQSEDHDGLLPPTVDRPRVSGSASSAPTLAKQQKDFSDWDREASSRTSTPVPAPANHNEWDELESPRSPSKPAKPLRQFVDRDEWEALQAPHLLGKSPASLGKSADPDAILPPVVQRPTASGSTSGEPIVAQQNGFSNRDREAPTAPTPATVDHDEWDALQAPKSVGKSTTSLGKSAEPDPILSPVVNKPRVSGSGASAPVSLKPSRSTSALLVDSSPRNTAPTHDGGYTMHEVPIAPSRPSTASVAGVRDTPELASSASREAGATLFQSFQAEDEETGEQKPAKKKWMIIAAISICSILLLLILGSVLLQHRTKSAAIQSVQPPPAISDAQPETNTPAPSASEPLPENKPSASTQVKSAADNQPAIKQNGVDPPQAQKDMMHDQLTAPLQIPQALKKQVAENGPPPESIGAAGTEGLGGGMNPNISNGQATPIVKPLKPLVISAGVATGLLIQKNAPTYPAIARSARVSGTVILEATITTTGTIKNLYAVSGPAMLRQAAVDAVRTWRYKPYKLNNDPVEVQATINVIFNLGP
jgi:protein TonB